MIGTEQLEESICDAFMDVEKWSRGRVESFDGTAGPMSFLHHSIHGVENLRDVIPCVLPKHRKCAEEMLLVSTTIPWSFSFLEVLREAIDDSCQAYRNISVAAHEFI